MTRRDGLLTGHVGYMTVERTLNRRGRVSIEAGVEVLDDLFGRSTGIEILWGNRAPIATVEQRQSIRRAAVFHCYWLCSCYCR